MNTEELKRFVALEERRRQLEAEIDTIKAEAAELEARLLPQFEQSGTGALPSTGAQSTSSASSGPRQKTATKGRLQSVSFR